MKKLLIGTAAGLGLLLFTSRKKLTNIATTAKSIDFKLVNIKNVRIQGNSLRFNVDVSLTNTSSQNLDVNTMGLITLEKLYYYDIDGNQIGQSTLNKEAIQISAGATINLLDIPTAIPISNIGGAIYSVINMLSNPAFLTTRALINTPAGEYLI